MDAMQRTVNYAKSHGLYVSTNAEDVSRADLDFLLEFAEKAQSCGADRLRFCDTVGLLGPFQIYDRIRLIEDTTERVYLRMNLEYTRTAS